MPASLLGEMDYHHGQMGHHHPLTTSSILGGGAVSPGNGHGSVLEDQRALQLALELSMLGLGDASSLVTGATTTSPDSHQSVVQSLTNGHQHSNGGMPQCNNNCNSGPDGQTLYGNVATMADDLRNLMPKKSQNMTECVPVPSSEHVAEIVGRQGCKIKALRAKTNTYIKTPVRGEEPVFVVTGRKEDVNAAKREILSAAEHFSQIRASRKGGSANGGPCAPAPVPGQITIQVRVPYRVVGLVVGPKGATIKRIQQTTHTYIVTPSRDKDPVFEVTGLPDNVQMAKREIEAHIAIRTGSLPMDNQSQALGQDDLTNSAELLASLYKNGLSGLSGLGLEGLGIGLGAINSLSSSLSSVSAMPVPNEICNNGGSVGSSSSGGGSLSSLSSLNGFSGNAITSNGGVGVTTSTTNGQQGFTAPANVYSQLSDLGFSFLDTTGQEGLMSSSRSEDSYLFGGSGPNSIGGSQTKLSDLFAATGTNNSVSVTSSLWGSFDRDEGLGESPTLETAPGTNFI